MKHKRMLTVVFSLILALTLSICSVFADNFSSPELPSDEELLTLVEDSVNAYKKQYIIHSVDIANKCIQSTSQNGYIRVVQIPRIVRKVFIRQPNRYAVFGGALLRDERDEFLLLPIPVDADKGFKLRARFHLASEKADDGAQQLLRNARKSRAKAGSYL